MFWNRKWTQIHFLSFDVPSWKTQPCGWLQLWRQSRSFANWKVHSLNPGCCSLPAKYPNPKLLSDPPIGVQMCVNVNQKALKHRMKCLHEWVTEVKLYKASSLSTKVEQKSALLYKNQSLTGIISMYSIYPCFFPLLTTLWWRSMYF